MPSLLIYTNGSQYSARCMNTRIEYDFLGAYPEEQLVNVKAFANSMRANQPLDVANVLDTQGTSPQTVAEQLFQDNDELWWQFNVVWECEEGEYLWNDLEQVGIDLLEAMG